MKMANSQAFSDVNNTNSQREKSFPSTIVVHFVFLWMESVLLRGNLKSKQRNRRTTKLPCSTRCWK